MKVVVTALPGSGKTTLMNELKKRMPDATFVNIGGMIAEVAMKKLGITNRDELRQKLTVRQQREFQEIVSIKIGSMRVKDMIIDTHTAVKTPNGFFPGTSETTIHLIKPDIIVLLEFRPEDILARRRKDPTRRRDQDTVELLEEHQAASKHFAFGAAQIGDAAVKVINLRYKEAKPFEHTMRAADEIVKLFKNQGKSA
jgi:adenylate kinase